MAQMTQGASDCCPLAETKLGLLTTVFIVVLTGPPHAYPRREADLQHEWNRFTIMT
jgi:hypothetical protein